MIEQMTDVCGSGGTRPAGKGEADSALVCPRADRFEVDQFAKGDVAFPLKKRVLEDLFPKAKISGLEISSTITMT